ncbi:hypothetical protein QFZ75_006958 [Streptomyces sp. V3I8]|nr:hypothetical protein [Streptomyces sp. V3I8]
MDRHPRHDRQHRCALRGPAPPRPAAFIHERFAVLLGSAATAVQEPELDEIALLECPADLENLPGPHVDHLKPIVDRYLQATS